MIVLWCLLFHDNHDISAFEALLSFEIASLVLQRLLFLTLLTQSEIEQCLSVQLLSMVVLMTFQ